MYKFELDEQEIAKFEEWQKSQEEKHPGHHTTIGGRWSFTFIPTGIGNIVKAADFETNEEIDLTDYELF